MSPLTDEEIRADAEHKKTVKVAERAKTLEAVAEWLQDDCEDAEHEMFDNQRMACWRCREVLLDATARGKMPEEKVT